jgi:hypothetical protein
VPTIVLGPPVDVVVAPEGIGEWGPYQFPGLERRPDGSILLRYHVEDDSARSYGMPPGRAVSADDGATWTVLPREESDADADGAKPSWSSAPITLADGGGLAARQLRPRDPAGLALPATPLATYKTYGKRGAAYLLGDLPPECAAGWQLLRKRPGGDDWVAEQAIVRLPGEVRDVIEGVMPFPWHQQIVVAPDGALWSVNYLRRAIDGVLRPTWGAVILRSTDQGASWDFWGEIPYVANTAADPGWAHREGFTEPFVSFLRDGSALCLLRTTDGTGIGPLYASRSRDNGRTWSRPEVFDDRGVWPQVIVLGNGVMLASYGRPGLFLRASEDPAARNWGARVTVVPPGDAHTETCSYSSLLPLNDETALIAYSEFRVPDDAGAPRKRIRVRRVTVRPSVPFAP